MKISWIQENNPKPWPQFIQVTRYTMEKTHIYIYIYGNQNGKKTCEFSFSKTTIERAVRTWKSPRCQVKGGCSSLLYVRRSCSTMVLETKQRMRKQMRTRRGGTQWRWRQRSQSEWLIKLEVSYKIKARSFSWNDAQEWLKGHEVLGKILFFSAFPSINFPLTWCSASFNIPKLSE